MSFDPKTLAGNPTGRPPQARIDIRQTTGLSCDECGSESFMPVVFIRHVSAILSPNGEEQSTPLSSFQCSKCSHINDDLNIAKQIAEAPAEG